MRFEIAREIIDASWRSRAFGDSELRNVWPEVWFPLGSLGQGLRGYLGSSSGQASNDVFTESEISAPSYPPVDSSLSSFYSSRFTATLVSFRANISRCTTFRSNSDFASRTHPQKHVPVGYFYTECHALLPRQPNSFRLNSIFNFTSVTARSVFLPSFDTSTDPTRLISLDFPCCS